MVLYQWSRGYDLVRRVPRDLFLYNDIDIIKSNPETIKQIYFLLNKEVSNT